MNYSKKKVFTLLVLFMLLLVAVLSGRFLSKSQTSEPDKSIQVEQPVMEQKSDQKAEVSFIINYGERKGSYSTAVQETDTVFSLLQKITQENNLSLHYSDSEFGVFVDQIGETKNTKDQFWVYDLNGTAGTVAADKQSVKAGDSVEWKFSKF